MPVEFGSFSTPFSRYLHARSVKGLAWLAMEASEKAYKAAGEAEAEARYLATIDVFCGVCKATKGEPCKFTVAPGEQIPHRYETHGARDAKAGVL